MNHDHLPLLNYRRMSSPAATALTLFLSGLNAGIYFYGGHGWWNLVATVVAGGSGACSLVFNLKTFHLYGQTDREPSQSLRRGTQYL